MYFELLHARLLDYLRGKVRSGEMTERGLARLAGISQPHLHNALKGVRVLSAGMADQVVLHLHLSAFDLLAENELGPRRGQKCPAPPNFTLVPLLAERLGPGCPFPDLEAESALLPFPGLEPAGMDHPIAVRLAPDAQSPALFQTDDIVLLDPLHSASQPLDPASYYAIAFGGSGCLRRVELRGDRLLLSAGAGPADPACISLPDRNILEVVRARAIWIGRNLERRPVAERPSQATRGEYRRPGEER